MKSSIRQIKFSRRQAMVHTAQTVAVGELGSSLAPLHAAQKVQPSPTVDGGKLTIGLATLGFL